MSPTRTSAANLAVLLALLGAGIGLWSLHARAWDLGRRSPVIGYDTGQYALAARELAEHGRLATTFALPIELARHATPPWPLAVLQPGLVLAEAAIFRVAPSGDRTSGAGVGPAQRGARAAADRPAIPPSQRSAWLTLALPILCFLLIPIVIAAVVAALLERHAPGVGTAWTRLAALTAGLAFVLDPEAQHFAAGGFTEMPFTLGLIAAIAMLAGGSAAARPLLFGLLLGATGSFRLSMLWLAPVFALGAASLAPARRARVAALALLGWAVVLAPWWLYKWRAFGDPGSDLTRLTIWEGVQGRSWFSLFHLPEPPALPHGSAAVGLIVAKIARRLPPLLSALAAGPRALWLGALVLWAAIARPARPLAVAAWVTVLGAALGLLSAAASIPWLRFLFPARVPLEAAGLLAVWGLMARAPATLIGPAAQRVLRVVVAALALGWGTLQTSRGLAEAREAAAQRGVPDVATLDRIVKAVDREIPANEVVMSNLGPMLAWASRRPVLHLALAPADLGACRRRLEFRHVLLVFRDPEQAWSGWQEVMERPGEATAHPDWNVVRERHWREGDGFLVVWLELGPAESRVAANAAMGNGRGPKVPAVRVILDSARGAACRGRAAGAGQT